jgi:hypothetical protein
LFQVESGIIFSQGRHVVQYSPIRQHHF